MNSSNLQIDKTKSDSIVVSFVESDNPNYHILTNGDDFDIIDINSGLVGCQWHRIRLDADIFENSSIRVSFAASDTIGSQTNFSGTLNFSGSVRIGYIDTTPGQYLSIRLTIYKSTPNSVTLRSIKVYYPRITYLQYLPAVYSEDNTSRDFLNRFLSLFEAVLSQTSEIISDIPSLFDPWATDIPMNNKQIKREDMICSWLGELAQWVGLEFDQNWSLDKRRQWLKRIVPLYKKRGTRDGLTEYIQMFVGDTCVINEPQGDFILGRQRTTVGTDAFVAGAPALFFRVFINYGYWPEQFNINEWRNVRKGICAIVDLEKPVLTYYYLDARTLGIVVGGSTHPQSNARSTVGRDTLLWEKSTPIKLERS